MNLSEQRILSELERIYFNYKFDKKYTSSYINILRFSIFSYFEHKTNNLTKEDLIKETFLFSSLIKFTELSNFNTITYIDDTLAIEIENLFISNLNPEYFVLKSQYLSPEESCIKICLSLFYKYGLYFGIDDYTMLFKHLNRSFHLGNLSLHYEFRNNKYSRYFFNNPINPNYTLVELFEILKNMNGFNKEFFNNEPFLISNIIYKSSPYHIDVYEKELNYIDQNSVIEENRFDVIFNTIGNGKISIPMNEVNRLKLGIILYIKKICLDFEKDFLNYEDCIITQNLNKK